MNLTTLVVGIGSPHGDDRVGWEIADAIGRQTGGSIATRCARTPAELLDWLEGVERLDTVHCWRWPADELEQAPFRTSHGLSLPAVLSLAETLGRLPLQVRIWGVSIDAPATFDALSPALAAAVPGIAQRVCQGLYHA
jgi:hydrogenase maturation protease